MPSQPNFSELILDWEYSLSFICGVVEVDVEVEMSAMKFVAMLCEVSLGTVSFVKEFVSFTESLIKSGHINPSMCFNFRKNFLLST